MNKEKLIKNWTEENEGLGKSLGYPDCCIKEFCEQPPELMKTQKPTKHDKRRYKASCINGVFSGFVPCKVHAKEITTGKITLDSLIDYKIRKLPFPYSALEETIK